MAHWRDKYRQEAEQMLEPLLEEIFNKGAAQLPDKMPRHYLTITFGYYAGEKHAAKPDIILIPSIIKALSLDTPFERNKVLGGRLGGVVKEACKDHTTIRAVEIDVYPEWLEDNVDESLGNSMASEIAGLIRDNFFQSDVAFNFGYKVRSSDGEEVDVSVPRPVTPVPQ